MDEHEDDAGDLARLKAAEVATALFSGLGWLQLLVWRCFAARNETHLVEGLTDFEAALRECIALREQGLAQGPEHATLEDLERVHRLVELVSLWLSGGELSPEIEPLARGLFEVAGGDVTGLPPP